MIDFRTERLLLGVFGLNANGGCVMSRMSTCSGSFDESMRVARAAEQLGFDLIVPISHWKGFGGATAFNEICLETFTWAAALASQTTSIYIFSTVHAPIVHPLIVAKQGATIDCISTGRWGLNIVAGWHEDDHRVFGIHKLQRSERYRLTREWTTLLKLLWTNEEVNFKGEFFCVANASVRPKPVQKPMPTLMNGGSSEEGCDFAINYTDINLAAFSTLEEGAAKVVSLRQKAELRGKRICIMTFCVAICSDTEREARRIYRRTVKQKDTRATRKIMGALSTESMSFTEHARLGIGRFAVGWGNVCLLGSPEQVAEQLASLRKIGVDGVLLCWLDYESGIQYFGEKVLPLLTQMGLR